eukprot:jgi/Tetstr1/448672/TSEL_035912.t1
MKVRETRLSFRPRPLDINKQLEIVRDVKDLDSSDGLVSREITHRHEALDKDNEAVLMVDNKKAKGGKEIPIPEVRFVPTYYKDYYPLFKPPLTYLHGKPGESYYGDTFVEYDLDQEDLAWLRNYNGSTGLLPQERFEMMLWKLDVSCHEATDRTLVAAGASMADRLSPAACATLEHFPRDVAMEILRKAVPYRQPVIDDVYRYWYNKRQQRQKPLLRRLQAPTAVTDTNPFNVFRPRERVNRPQTRRRRENDISSLDKMKNIQQNLEGAIKLMENLIRREYKKRDVKNYDIDIQQLQLQLRHEPKSKHEQLELDAMAAMKARQKRATEVERDMRDMSWLDRVQAALIDNPVGLLQVGSVEAREMLRKVSKRKRRVERRPNVAAVASLPAPLKPAQEEMLFTYQPDLGELLEGDGCLAVLPPKMSRRGMSARVGRGGRLVFDRAALDFAESFSPPPLVPMPAANGADVPAGGGPLGQDAKRPKLASSPGEGGGPSTAGAPPTSGAPNGSLPAAGRQPDAASGSAPGAATAGAGSPSTPEAAKGADGTPLRGRGSDKKRGLGRPPKDGKRVTPNGDTRQATAT